MSDTTPPPPRPGWATLQPPAPGQQPQFQPGWGQPSAPAPQKPPWSKGKRVAVGAGVIVGGLVLIGALGKHQNTDSTTASASSSPKAAAPAPATTAASSAPKPDPTTAAPTPTHNADYQTGQQILTWYAGGGQTAIDNITTDAQAISTDASNNDTNAVAADCGTLKGHVRDAQTYAAFPDTDGQTHWSKALALYKQAATDCITGASNMDASALGKGAGELTQGTAETAQLTARVKEITAAAH